MLSEAAAEGQGVQALESALEQLAGWLQTGDDAEAIAAGGRAGRRPRRRPPVPAPGPRRHRPPLGPRDHPPAAAQVGPGPLAARGPRTASATRSTPWPTCAGRPGRGPRPPRPRLRGARARIGRRAARRWSDMLGHHGVDPGRVELDLGFGRGIGFYTQMIFELDRADPGGPGRGLRRRPLRRPGPRAGQRPRRPRRRLRLRAGTAARGSRRASRTRRHAARVGFRGYLVTSGKPAEVTPAAIDLATFLRERIAGSRSSCPTSEFQAAVEQARALGLGQVVTVGRTIELWNLEHGDVRSVRRRRADRPDAHAAWPSFRGRSTMSTPRSTRSAWPSPPRATSTTGSSSS